MATPIVVLLSFRSFSSLVIVILQICGKKLVAELLPQLSRCLKLKIHLLSSKKRFKNLKVDELDKTKVWQLETLAGFRKCEEQDEELDELRACVERIGGVVLFWQSVGSISTISYANTFGVSGENIRRVGY
ncbi:hypothetical protein V6N12_070900 [Hibiscus sabdariffa]|uniref:Uncharacterized protein n=1 Tax=Hibiscus sabdariffa TaxID=183260 RepID=A0ABR2FI66_9ROSI